MDFRSTHSDTSRPQYFTQPKDNSARASLLIYVFVAVIVIDVIAILVQYYSLTIIDGLIAGDYIEDATIEMSDNLVTVVWFFEMASIITSIVVFLNWFRRAYGNLNRTKVSKSHSSESMAVWYWFIPIASLYKPVTIMNEIWTKTQRAIKKYDSDYSIKDGTLYLVLWWTLYLVTNILGRLMFRDVLNDETLEEMQRSSHNYIIQSLLQIIEAIAVILLVSRISSMESRLKTLLKRNSENNMSRNRQEAATNQPSIFL